MYMYSCILGLSYCRHILLVKKSLSHLLLPSLAPPSPLPPSSPGEVISPTQLDQPTKLDEALWEEFLSKRNVSNDVCVCVHIDPVFID